MSQASNSAEPRRPRSRPKWDHTMTLSEFKVKESDRAQAEPASGRVLLQIGKPWFNHLLGQQLIFVGP